MDSDDFRIRMLPLEDSPMALAAETLSFVAVLELDASLLLLALHILQQLFGVRPRGIVLSDCRHQFETKSVREMLL